MPSAAAAHKRQRTSVLQALVLQIKFWHSVSHVRTAKVSSVVFPTMVQPKRLKSEHWGSCGACAGRNRHSQAIWFQDPTDEDTDKTAPGGITSQVAGLKVAPKPNGSSGRDTGENPSTSILQVGFMHNAPRSNRKKKARECSSVKTRNKATEAIRF